MLQVLPVCMALAERRYRRNWCIPFYRQLVRIGSAFPRLHPKGTSSRFALRAPRRLRLLAIIRNTKTDANLGDTPQVTPQVKIIAFCSEPRSKAEIANHCGFKDIKHFTARYLKPLLESGQLRMTAPDKPNSSKQKYITVQPSQ